MEGSGLLNDMNDLIYLRIQLFIITKKWNEESNGYPLVVVKLFWGSAFLIIKSHIQRRIHLNFIYG